MVTTNEDLRSRITWVVARLSGSRLRDLVHVVEDYAPECVEPYLPLRRLDILRVCKEAEK